MTIFILKNPPANPEEQPRAFEAMRYTGHNLQALKEFAGPRLVWIREPTFEGLMWAPADFPCWVEVGDWITRSAFEETDVWPAAAFSEKFEAVDPRFMTPADAAAELEAPAPLENPPPQLRLAQAAILKFFLEGEKQGACGASANAATRPLFDELENMGLIHQWPEPGTWSLTAAGRRVVQVEG